MISYCKIGLIELFVLSEFLYYDDIVFSGMGKKLKFFKC